MGRLRARRRRVVQAGDDRRRPARRLLGLRGSPHLRAQAARRDPPRRHPRRRRAALRSQQDVHRGDDLRGDAARLLRARRARRRPRARRRRRLDRVPHVPALLRSDVPRGERSRAGSRVRPRLQRLHDRRVVRRLRRPPASAVPDPALGRRPRGRRGQSQRGARRACDLLQRDPDAPRVAEHPHRLLGSPVRRVRRDAHRRLHAHRILLEDAGGLSRLATLDARSCWVSTTRWHR